jgi:hypothetical protein
MNYDLRPGDRVRVTVLSRVGGYRPGARGTVLGGREASAVGWRYFVVRMDGAPMGTWTIFAADEIEPDAAVVGAGAR